jgi:hypothetical protein
MEYEIYRVDELCHHGIRGMRWGVRRYQNKDGSLTPAGKKRQEREEREREAHEANKQRVLQSGSAKEVMKYKGQLTPQEMQFAIQRLRWEQDMNTIAARDVEAGKKKADAVINDVINYANTGAKVYNTFANIYNAFSKGDVSLPKIDTNITSGNKAERKAERDALKKANKTTDLKNLGKLEKLSDDELAAVAKRAANEKLVEKYQSEGVIATKESRLQSQRDAMSRRAEPKQSNTARDYLIEDARSRRNGGKTDSGNPEVRYRMDRRKKKSR